MRKIANPLLVLLFAFNAIAYSNAQSNKNLTSDESLVKTKKVEVYYFHYTRRCATCNAVENESKKALEILYAEKVKAGTITFQSINLDDDSSKEIVEKLNVSGQTLLFVSGSETVNLTNKGFMYALSNPDKLKEEIKKTVDDLLSQ